MRTETGKLEGDTTITEDFRLMGVIDGDVLVTNGAHLQLMGVVGGHLRVDQGATAHVMGVVGGRVFAEGETQISGVVTGPVGGPGLTVNDGSIIDGVRQTQSP